MMPLEKASRSPRVCSCRGRYRSSARIEPSSGKPLNAVFAARIRISAVVAWMKKNPTECVAAEHRRGDLGDDGALRRGRAVAGKADQIARRSPRRAPWRSRASAVMPANMMIASDAHRGQGPGGVLALRRPERRHPVGDRLDPGQRRAARTRTRASASSVSASPVSPTWCGCTCQPADSATGALPERRAGQPDHDHDQDPGDEQVRRHRERPARTRARRAGSSP